MTTQQDDDRPSSAGDYTSSVETRIRVLPMSHEHLTVREWPVVQRRGDHPVSALMMIRRRFAAGHNTKLWPRLLRGSNPGPAAR